MKVFITFAGTFADGLTFLDVSDEQGRSVKVGEWVRDGDAVALALDIADPVHRFSS